MAPGKDTNSSGLYLTDRRRKLILDFKAKSLPSQGSVGSGRWCAELFRHLIQTDPFITIADFDSWINNKHTWIVEPYVREQEPEQLDCPVRQSSRISKRASGKLTHTHTDWRNYLRPSASSSGPSSPKTPRLVNGMAQAATIPAAAAGSIGSTATNATNPGWSAGRGMGVGGHQNPGPSSAARSASVPNTSGSDGHQLPAAAPGFHGSPTSVQNCSGRNLGAFCSGSCCAGQQSHVEHLSNHQAQFAAPPAGQNTVNPNSPLPPFHSIYPDAGLPNLGNPNSSLNSRIPNSPAQAGRIRTLPRQQVRFQGPLTDLLHSMPGQQHVPPAQPEQQHPRGESEAADWSIENHRKVMGIYEACFKISHDCSSATALGLSESLRWVDEILSIAQREHLRVINVASGRLPVPMGNENRSVSSPPPPRRPARPVPSPSPAFASARPPTLPVSSVPRLASMLATPSRSTAPRLATVSRPAVPASLSPPGPTTAEEFAGAGTSASLKRIHDAIKKARQGP